PAIGPGGSGRGLPPGEGVREVERAAAGGRIEVLRQSAQRRGGIAPAEGSVGHRLPPAAPLVPRRRGGRGQTLPPSFGPTGLPQGGWVARGPPDRTGELARGGVRLLRAVAAQPAFDRLRDRRRRGEGGPDRAAGGAGGDVARAPVGH